jgi:hypothetical protein
MNLIADKRGRLTCIELFRPGTVFDVQRQADGTIRIVELARKQSPLVSLVRSREGFLMLPVKLDRAAVAAAIRTDRDAE